MKPSWNGTVWNCRSASGFGGIKLPMPSIQENDV